MAGKLPPILVEIAIGVAMPVVMTLLRLTMVPWTADRAPYALVFVAAVAASVLAGWRSGILASMVGQALAWKLVVEPAASPEQLGELLGGLVLATLAQLVAVVIIALYQREVGRASARSSSEMELLQKALAEIDHRTVNNYQAVLSLILAQAKATREQPAKDALQKIADRIKAIANASRRLAASSKSLEKVRLDEHLHELCAQIEAGLARPGLSLECQFAAVALDADDTNAMSMLVNELVTNALKHAFPGDRQGVVRVRLGRVGNAVELSVGDNGIGLGQAGRARGSGLGTRLVDTFVRQLGAKHDILSDEGGTRHRIRIPADRRQAGV